jgi:TonB family protein
VLRRIILFQLLSSLVLVAQNLAAADLAPNLIIDTRTGPLHNTARYAPEPDIPRQVLAQCPVGHDSFAIDVDYRSGMPDGVRVVKSTGCTAIDNAVMAALRKWCFLPHAFRKVIVPVNFDFRKK